MWKLRFQVLFTNIKIFYWERLFWKESDEALFWSLCSRNEKILSFFYLLHLMKRNVIFMMTEIRKSGISESERKNTWQRFARRLSFDLTGYTVEMCSNRWDRDFMSPRGWWRWWWSVKAWNTLSTDIYIYKYFYHNCTFPLQCKFCMYNIFSYYYKFFILLQIQDRHSPPRIRKIYIIYIKKDKI